MTDRLLKQLGPRYPLVMMLVTRLFALIGGGLVIYYINLTISLPPSVEGHLLITGAVVVLLAIVVTLCLTMWETRDMRAVIVALRDGECIDPDVARRAARSAVLFPGHHVWWEAFIDPCVTVLPLSMVLWIADGVSWNVIGQIAIAGFIGIASVLLATYFICEIWLAPVIRMFVNGGIEVSFESYPVSRLHLRMYLSFGLIIVVTALMIGSLSNQRAMDIISQPAKQAEAVQSLRQHTIYIFLFAVSVGLVLSRMLSNSIATRVDILMKAMKRVQQGNLAERVAPTGNDEIDVLARQFNTMVEKLERDDHTIRDLNANLEQKVKFRTHQLSKSKRTLHKSFRKLKDYDRVKTEFFSNVSHELRTPLTMILAPVERILNLDRSNLSPEVVSHLETVRINGHRLLKLINQLLDFAKLEAGHTQLKIVRCDVNEIVSELTQAMSPLVEHLGLELRVELDSSLLPFGADQEKLDTVITNLLSNALKFTPSGGRIHVATSLEEGVVRVSVTDTGVGIAPKDQARIFERFFQVDGSSSRERPGTGLGMALSKELIELHGGAIGLDSELGVGSCFTITLPYAEVPAADDDGSSRPAASNTKGPGELLASKSARIYQRFADQMVCKVNLPVANAAGRTVDPGAAKVLIVDDTPEIRTLVAELLSDQYAVLLAKDGAEGHDIAQREMPDLIISDVMMPKVDGYEFCRRIKEDPRTARIPFVMLTAKADRSMIVAGLDHGADEYLAKPFDANELLARVRSMLRLRQMHTTLDTRNSELQATVSELRSTQAQLIQSEKMSSLGQLVAGLAHEINNSINAVYNGIQPLRRKTERLQQLILSDRRPEGDGISQEILKNFEKVSQLAEIIEHGASRTAQIVQDLKTFSHPGCEALENFNIHEALDVCINLMASRFRNGVAIHRAYEADGMIRGPYGQLNQVLMNLLGNAHDAIKGDGAITISTSNTDSGIVVKVRDSGGGIPESVQSKIFDPFFTTKPPGKGTGLGLSISHSLIAQLGGTISFESHADFGTEFTISLPRGISSRTADRAQTDEIIATST